MRRESADRACVEAWPVQLSLHAFLLAQRLPAVLAVSVLAYSYRYSIACYDRPEGIFWALGLSRDLSGSGSSAAKRLQLELPIANGLCFVHGQKAIPDAESHPGSKGRQQVRGRHGAQSLRHVPDRQSMQARRRVVGLLERWPEPTHAPRKETNEDAGRQSCSESVQELDWVSKSSTVSISKPSS